MKEDKEKGKNHAKVSMSAMDKVLKTQSNIRVSEESKKVLAEVMKKIGKEVAISAVKAARHAGRRTITKEDVQWAIKEKDK